MSKMDPLIELQSIDSEIRDLRQIIDDAPGRKEQEARRLTSLKEELASSENDLNTVRREVDQAELEVNTLRDKLLKLKQQQMALKTNKEFKAMELEIAMLEQEIDHCETGLLSAMEKIGPAEKRVGENRSRLDEEEQLVAEYQRDLDLQIEDASERLEQMTRERESAAGNVDPEILDTYTRLSAGKWPAVVAIEKDACGGCHMTQPPSVKHLARRGDGTAVCHFCGRILFLRD